MNGTKVFPGDLAEYAGRNTAGRCEVMAYTAKRVAIAVRLESGAVAVRYVKAEKLKRVGGGVLNADREDNP